MKDKITVTAIVNVISQKVWDYYTNPVHITQWNFADASWHCPNTENDLCVGGTYNARMEAKDGSAGFDFIAVYTQLEEGKVFSYEFGGRVAQVTFEDLGTQTRVTVSFDPENENSLELQKNGWQMILNNFKAYAESLG